MKKRIEWQTNQSYGLDWSSYLSPHLGEGAQQGLENADDKFQRAYQASAAESQEEAKTKEANATGRRDDIQGHTTNSSSSSRHYGHFKHEEQQAATALDDPTETTSKTIYKNSANENLSDEAAEEQEHDKFTIYKSPHTVNLEGILGIIMQAKQKQKQTL